MLKSIYVPLAVLYYDLDLMFTIKGLSEKSSKENNIHIHASIVGMPEHLNGFDESINEIHNAYPHVKITYQVHAPLIKNMGVGPGRSLAMLGYKDEDYMLQIDPHTFLDYNWDNIFISMLDESISLTKNNKTILTCYLDRYTYDENGLPNSNFNAHYCFFDVAPKEKQAKSNYYGEVIPIWQLCGAEDMRNISQKKYYPSIKFNANLSFGNKEFINHTGLFKEAIFYEEEILQTIDLFNNGFCLVYPSSKVPAAHLYQNESESPIPRRKSISDLINWDLCQEQTAHNFVNYLNSNKDSVERYQNYINFDFHKQTRIDLSGPHHIPSVPEYFLNEGQDAR